MANKIRHLLHRRSLKSSPFTVNIERGSLDVQNPKAPLADNIEYGELAINYGKGHEGLFLRNSENEVIQLNTMKHIRYDGAVDTSFEKYLDDRFVNRSGDTMYGDFTITKEWNTDDPKFKYIGSYFGVSGTTIELSGDTMNVTENTVNTDIETGFTNIKEHKYEGINLDADVTNANWSGDTFHMIQDTKFKIDTDLFDLSGTTTNMSGDTLNVLYKNVNLSGTTDIDVVTPDLGVIASSRIDIDTTIFDLSGTTTNMQGTLLDIDYTNIDLSGSTDIDIVSPKVNIDASSEVTISGTTEVQIDSDLIDINGTTTTMDGDTLTVNYKNIDLSGSTDIDITTPEFNLSGTTTNMEGDTLNVDYDNLHLSGITNLDIDAENTTLDGCSLVVTETCKIDVITPDFELSGGTAWLHGTEIKVEYDNIDLSGSTDIDIVSPDIEIDTDLFDLSGTTTNLHGTTLDVDYDNIDFEASVDIDIISPIVDIDATTQVDITTPIYNLTGTTTNMQGDTLNVDYKNIKVSAITEDHYVNTTNFYGDVNISKNLTVSGDTNISGDTTIWGDLILNPEKSFDGKLKYPLNFKIATSATKTNSATLIASVDELKYNNSNAENYITEIGSEDPLVTKGYIDDVFENILDDKKVTAAIDSFKELQEVLGVTNNGDITSTTYDTVVNGINAKVNRSGDTMTGNLNISTGVTLTTSGTITAKSDVTTNTKFIGNLDKTLTLNSGTFSSKTFNNSNDVTVNIPTDISHLSCTGEPTSWTSLDERYVNVSGDTMTGKLNISDGGLAVSGASTFNGDVTTSTKFIGNLDKTLTFTGGTFSSSAFNNSNDVTVNIPTDISHLSCTGEPSSWTSLDERYVNVSGDTMTGNLNISTGVTLTTSGTITAKSDVTTNTKFIGNLDKTLTFTSGTFSSSAFNNSNDITVNVPTDISHLSWSGDPTSWTSLDERYVNVSGDTMTGKLNISDGGLAVSGASTFNGNMSVTGTITATSAIYSSDKNLKENIKNINKYDIATVADVDLKSYKFIDDETHRERYGVIAQDLESVGLEHLVVKGENGKKGVDYISFLILKIAQLEKEIEDLKKKK